MLQRTAPIRQASTAACRTRALLLPICTHPPVPTMRSTGPPAVMAAAAAAAPASSSQSRASTATLPGAGARACCGACGGCRGGGAAGAAPAASRPFLPAFTRANTTEAGLSVRYTAAPRRASTRPGRPMPAPSSTARSPAKDPAGCPSRYDARTKAPSQAQAPRRTPPTPPGRSTVGFCFSVTLAGGAAAAPAGAPAAAAAADDKPPAGAAPAAAAGWDRCTVTRSAACVCARSRPVRLPRTGWRSSGSQPSIVMCMAAGEGPTRQLTAAAQHGGDGRWERHGQGGASMHGRRRQQRLLAAAAGGRRQDGCMMQHHLIACRGTIWVCWRRPPALLAASPNPSSVYKRLQKLGTPLSHRQGCEAAPEDRLAA